MVIYIINLVAKSHDLIAVLWHLAGQKLFLNLSVLHLNRLKLLKRRSSLPCEVKKWLRRDDGILSNTFLQRVSRWSERRGRDGVASAAAYDM